MTRTKLIRLSGWGLVLAAICLLLTFLSLPESVGTMLFFLAILLITLGLLGLRARYGDQAGNVAKIALGIGILGGVAALVSNVWMAIGFENGRSLMNLSMAVLFAGLFAFGWVALRKKPMLHGNGLPILAGLCWPLIVIVANVFHQVTGYWLEVPYWLSLAIFSAMGFSLALLGYYILQSDGSDQSGAVVGQMG